MAKKDKPLICDTWMGNFREECSDNDTPKKAAPKKDAPYKKVPRKIDNTPYEKVPRKSGYAKGGMVTKANCGASVPPAQKSSKLRSK
jgi:hypothetical protein